MSTHAAGWYPDPVDGAKQRYWDGSAWTAQRDIVAPPPPATRGKRPTGLWYFVITIASAGLFSAVPFFHAASRLDRPHLRKVGAAFAAAGLVSFILLGSSPEDAEGTPTGWAADAGGLMALTVMLVATLLLIGLRREVYRPRVVMAPPVGNAGAMATVEAARRRRAEARQLAARDPLMARELGIGRLESQHGYDDGGLVDLNAVSAQQLSAVCGLPPETAAQVIESREALGRFTQVEDAIVFGQVSEVHAPVLRERAIVITDPVG
ncbi:DUF2510 domain-containing protein [Nocardioides campestrisoli]|uniref:DUF2510 domain-containing protein n=1 Tax=Nocardioides campestrisoli TaxID=2736757 RepID=UPI0015E71454|nr:DUF2510 domain-containing protein [Nocardioides campestrisoli]